MKRSQILTASFETVSEAQSIERLMQTQHTETNLNDATSVVNLHLIKTAFPGVPQHYAIHISCISWATDKQTSPIL